MAKGTTKADDLEKYRKLLPSLGKRPRAVLEAILKNGSVSTYELGELGYDQPPRAAQDLKEAGVMLRTTYGKHPESGARMGIYSLAGIGDTAVHAGRRAFPKAFRERVLNAHGMRCNICNVEYPATVLQIDHRVPYIVGGDGDELEIEGFQPLCGSHQRLKSWECEHCPNREGKSVDLCHSCYWATPDGKYDHVATRPERRADVTWTGKETAIFEKAKKQAERRGMKLETFLKEAIKEVVRGGGLP